MFFSHCKKKNNQPIDKSNIVLYDKSLSVIKECLQGKWELNYAKGGFTGNYTKYYHDEYWEFNDTNIKITDSGSVYIDTAIVWKYEPLSLINGQNTYSMNFNSRDNVPHKYYVEGIKEDTLSIADFGVDGMGYFFTKSN